MIHGNLPHDLARLYAATKGCLRHARKGPLWSSEPMPEDFPSDDPAEWVGAPRSEWMAYAATLRKCLGEVTEALAEVHLDIPEVADLEDARTHYEKLLATCEQLAVFAEGGGGSQWLFAYFLAPIASPRFALNLESEIVAVWRARRKSVQLKDVQADRERITKEQAEAAARILVAREPSLAEHPNVSEWARKIRCSRDLVYKLETYRKCRDASGKTGNPRAVTFSAELESVMGRDDEALRRVMEEQAADMREEQNPRRRYRKGP